MLFSAYLHAYYTAYAIGCIMKDIKEWVDAQIYAMECQFLVHKDGLGLIHAGVGYWELGEASSQHPLKDDVNPIEVFTDGFYYGELQGEYLKLCEVRGKLNGIDYNLED